MLRFQSNHWWSELFIFYGGIVPDLLIPAILYTTYTTFAYYMCKKVDFQAAADGTNLMASCVTFLLVFRLQQSFLRYTKAKTLSIAALAALRVITFHTCEVLNHNFGQAYKSTPPHIIRQAHALIKVHVVRLSIAFAVSLKYHMRAADLRYHDVVPHQSWRDTMADFLRLKDLLSEAETKVIDERCGLYEKKVKTSDCIGHETKQWIPKVRFGTRARSEDQTPVFSPRAVYSQMLLEDSDSCDSSDLENSAGACGIPVIILQLLRNVLASPLGAGWGYPERVLQVVEPQLHAATVAYLELENFIRMPVPLPYMQLCRVLLLIFVLSYPLTTDLEHGIWGNIVTPTLLSLSLYSLDRVAYIIDNPVGDHSSSLSLYELIHQFEYEVQTIFDMSEQDMQGFHESWHDLSRHFGFNKGAGVTGATDESFGLERYRFEDFFRWADLPHHTLNYIKRQSGNLGTFTACFAARERLMPTRDSEVHDSPLMSDNSDEFLIKRGVALKGREEGRAQSKKQLAALDRLNSMEAPRMSTKKIMSPPRRTRPNLLLDEP